MRRWLFGVALLLATVPGFASSDNDRVTAGSDITVAEGETADDVVCMFCTVRIHGEVKGDVAVLFGSVIVDDDRGVKGDLVIFGGDLLLGSDSWIGHDVSVMAGDVKTGSGAMIHGSSTVFPGRIWLLLPFAPFLIVIGVCWLVVYLLRRNRYEFPAYPYGRGFPGRP